jgi:hypothetical protein
MSLYIHDSNNETITVRDYIEDGLIIFYWKTHSAEVDWTSSKPLSINNFIFVENLHIGFVEGLRLMISDEIRDFLFEVEQKKTVKDQQGKDVVMSITGPATRRTLSVVSSFDSNVQYTNKVYVPDDVGIQDVKFIGRDDGYVIINIKGRSYDLTSTRVHFIDDVDMLRHLFYEVCKETGKANPVDAVEKIKQSLRIMDQSPNKESQIQLDEANESLRYADKAFDAVKKITDLQEQVILQLQDKIKALEFKH